MSAVSTATALAASSAAQTQAALATTIIKQNHDAQAGLVAVIEQAIEAGRQAAASPTADGIGAVVDVHA